MGAENVFLQDAAGSSILFLYISDHDRGQQGEG